MKGSGLALCSLRISQLWVEALSPTNEATDAKATRIQKVDTLGLVTNEWQTQI